MMTNVSRIAAAVFGGYAFTWGFATLAIAAMAAAGVDFHEAETGVLMLAFLVFLIMFLWSFAARSVTRVWLVLAGGAGTMIGAGMTLQHFMLG